jgi:aspartyl aminopeptidase
LGRCLALWLGDSFVESSLIDRLKKFLGASPTPYHATENLVGLFKSQGFTALDERDEWQLESGKSYYVTRSDASIIAFTLGEKPLHEAGFRLVGTHTDSPCLKVKPQPELLAKNCFQLGVEVYGGALLNPWFDRDLSIAGKVTGELTNGELVSRLIDFKRPVAVIPSLAIHLNREANTNKSVNAQKEMNALLSLSESKLSFRELLAKQFASQYPELQLKEIYDFNLSFYDVQEPACIGLEEEFLASARLDNLLSTFIAADSLLASNGSQTAILICNDHEEVGSRSDSGAQGTMLRDLLARIEPGAAQRHRAVCSSMMLSVDNAHAVHPNYAEKHDASHGPLLNSGPVLKFDADQSYATSSDTAAILRWLAAQDEKIPLQSFVTRADMRCGSTIGPITSASLGLKTADLGVPQLAMHSIRELAGTRDVIYLFNLLQRFYDLTRALV